jgi:hypothetical protein
VGFDFGTFSSSLLLVAKEVTGRQSTDIIAQLFLQFPFFFWTTE